MMEGVRALTTGFVWLITGIGPSAPNTFVVDTSADVVDALDGVMSLREAVLAANEAEGPDVIELPSGFFFLTIENVAGPEDEGLTDDLDVTGELTIRGTSKTAIDGSKLDRILHAHPGSKLRLEQVSLRNGRAEIGGAVLAEGGLWVEGCSFTGNVAEATEPFGSNASATGGAIHAGGGLFVANSIFLNNAAIVGGLPRDEDPTLPEDASARGGAIATSGPVTIRTTISRRTMRPRTHTRPRSAAGAPCRAIHSFDGA